MDAMDRAARAGTTERPVWRAAQAESDFSARSERDRVAVEEPLEIRVAGDAVATTLRTPGDDGKLAAGFLFAEGILRSARDLSSLSHCGRPGEGYGNVIDARPSGGVVFDVERTEPSRRGTLTTSACGVCGRRTVDDLLSRCAALPAGGGMPRGRLLACVARLAPGQALFFHTGGTHSAAAFDAGGALLVQHEDVGRHNAVDKVVGALLLDGRVGPDAPGPPPALLVVSGRASFEVVQKAAMARIPVVASVSAASSLAIDLAQRVGITLAAFVREARLNVYTCPERLEA